MNILKKFLNLFKKNDKIKNNILDKKNESFYSYIFNNDSIWLFYKKHDFKEKDINLQISF